jgi:DNA-binding winged helix-turn-helix (wHTH) protein
LPPKSGTVSALARFGVFEIDLDTGELRRAGRRIAIQQHSFLVLKALVERAGEEVTREELRRRLWPNQEFLDFENGINTAVGRLRHALGDVAETPRYIGTRRGHGYQLLAPVVWVDRVPSAPSRPSEPAIESAMHAPDGENITGSFALSPSGRWLVFVTGGSMPDESHLCLRSLTDVTVRTLPGTTGATLPFWSPDEGALGFFADGHLKTIDIGSAPSGPSRTRPRAAAARGVRTVRSCSPPI